MTEQKTPKGRLAAMGAIAIVVALIWFFDFLPGPPPGFCPPRRPGRTRGGSAIGCVGEILQTPGSRAANARLLPSRNQLRRERKKLSRVWASATRAAMRAHGSAYL